MNYKCYIIFNDNYSYVGITNNLNKRIRQHNQIIKGGAKYTSLINSKMKTNWNYGCYVDGFKNKIDALRFEWALKHVKPNTNIDDWIEFIEDRNFNDKRYAINNKKLKSLGWNERIPFNIGISTTINWILKNKDYWD